MTSRRGFLAGAPGIAFCSTWTITLRTLLTCLVLLLLLAQAAVAQELHGRAVGISNGDTLTLLTERREEVRIRLSEIDTPERGQPYGTRARQALSDLAFGKTVRIAVRDIDRYGRTVGRVHVGAQDGNAEMVRRGAAWVYRRYSDNPTLLRLKQAARAERLGLNIQSIDCVALEITQRCNLDCTLCYNTVRVMVRNISGTMIGLAAAKMSAGVVKRRAS